MSAMADFTAALMKANKHTPSKAKPKKAALKMKKPTSKPKPKAKPAGKSWSY